MTTIESSLLNHLTGNPACVRSPKEDPGLAADVVQESLLKAVKSQNQLQAARSTRNKVNVRLQRTRQRLKQRLDEAGRVRAAHGCLDCQCEPSTVERRD